MDFCLMGETGYEKMKGIREQKDINSLGVVSSKSSVKQFPGPSS